MRGRERFEGDQAVYSPFDSSAFFFFLFGFNFGRFVFQSLCNFWKFLFLFRRETECDEREEIGRTIFSIFSIEIGIIIFPIIIFPFFFIFRFMRGVHVGESGARTSGESQVRQGDDLYKVRGG